MDRFGCEPKYWLASASFLCYQVSAKFAKVLVVSGSQPSRELWQVRLAISNANGQVNLLEHCLAQKRIISDPNSQARQFTPDGEKPQVGFSATENGAV